MFYEGVDWIQLAGFVSVLLATITFNLSKAILPDARARGIDCNVSALRNWCC
jgi:hypothetical protein